MSDAMQALYEGDAERAKSLLPPDEQLDVFHAAAFGRTQRLSELLADDPEQAKAYSGDGFTPLHLAVYAEQPAAAQQLIEAGADLDAISTGSIAQVSPLGTAAFVRSVSMARLLLDAGADVNARRAAGSTPLDSAIANGDDELARELRSRGGLPG